MSACIWVQHCNNKCDRITRPKKNPAGCLFLLAAILEDPQRLCKVMCSFVDSVVTSSRPLARWVATKDFLKAFQQLPGLVNIPGMWDMLKEALEGQDALNVYISSSLLRDYSPPVPPASQTFSTQPSKAESQVNTASSVSPESPEKSVHSGHR